MNKDLVDDCMTDYEREQRRKEPKHECPECGAMVGMKTGWTEFDESPFDTPDGVEDLTFYECGCGENFTVGHGDGIAVIVEAEA